MRAESIRDYLQFLDSRLTKSTDREEFSHAWGRQVTDYASRES